MNAEMHILCNGLTVKQGPRMVLTSTLPYSL
uniref:Uncharacterized protein n=1 Tax=Anguilla anguilla TaxID=7936 RepID=A0A0E9VW71_ANGAN